MNLWKIIACLAVLGLAASTFFTFQVNAQRQKDRDEARSIAVREAYQRDVAVRNAQVVNCQIVGDPLRKAVIQKSRIDADRLREDIRTSKQQEAQGIFAELFPSRSDAEVKRLLEQSRQRDGQQAKDLDKIARRLSNVPPCEERYPQVTPPSPLP